MPQSEGPMQSARGYGNTQQLPPIRTRLIQRQQVLEEELQKIAKLLETLDKTPAIEKFVDLMGGIQY